jgi:hypothetical protein
MTTIEKKQAENNEKALFVFMLFKLFFVENAKVETSFDPFFW